MSGDATAKLVLAAADQALRQIHRRSRTRASRACSATTVRYGVANHPLLSASCCRTASSPSALPSAWRSARTAPRSAPRRRWLRPRWLRHAWAVRYDLG